MKEEKMKIYIVEGNNGEMYENYYEWIESVYLSKEEAKKEVKRLNKKAKEDYRKNGCYELCKYEIKEYDIK